MKTIQEIKENYAQEQGYEDWEQLEMRTWSDEQMGIHWTEICMHAQKEALEKAAENAKIEMDFQLDWHSINKESITTPENLIR